MNLRIAPTHLIFLLLTVGATIYIGWSAVSASAQLNNLVVVVPVAISIALLTAIILVQTVRGRTASGNEETGGSSLLADLALLACFALFCIALSPIGFDVATFIFVWIGIVLGGERRLWLPPLYSAGFTLLLVWGLGSLFPFPMPMLFL